jgi:hypothetical protein
MNDTRRPQPWLELLITLVLPALVLLQLSAPQRLGPVAALLLALAFPLGWGLRDFLTRRRLNIFAGLGLVSVLLTGGIGLLELDTGWLAVKEAAIPGVLGLIVAGSALSRYPLVRVLLYTPILLDTTRIDAALAERDNQAAFDARLRAATWMLAGSFAFSAGMNFVLASWIVTSPAGTAAFNEELGRMTLLLAAVQTRGKMADSAA